VGIENRQIPRPEQLFQIAAVRNQGIACACARRAVFNRNHRATLLLRQAGHNTRHRRQQKKRDFFQEQIF
jgi:hypothetical protein